MGLDGMRVGGGRCPPLFVGGLLLACLLLVCNWWSISTENLELLRQIDELNEQLKISAEERDQCVTLRESDVTSLKKQNSDLTESVTICKSELDSSNKVDAMRIATLESLRLEKNSMSTQLDVTKQENEKLKADLETAISDNEKLKLAIDAQKEKVDEPMPQLLRGRVDKAQLPPVPDSAVQISVSGQRGMKFHGVPILPRDPPGVTRRIPRLSVAIPKAPPPNTVGQDNSANEGNAKENLEDENAVDASGVENRFAPQDGSAADEKAEGEQQ